LNEGTAQDPARWASVCLNCAQPLTGRFCSACGQRAVPPHPTVPQLAGDAWEELIGWDGRLARTIATLFRRPGELTRAVLEGQRARYVSPVRVYLACSLVYFVVAAAAPVPDVEFELGIGVGAESSETTPEEAALTRAMMNGLATLTPEERAMAETAILEQPAFFHPLLRALAEDFQGVRQRTIQVMPRALFVLIPALTVIIAGFHRRRPYPDHWYFALHLQTFVFVVLTGVALASMTQSLDVLMLAQGGAGLVIVAYTVMAQRRVYGGSWGVNILKAAGVGALYLVLWGMTSLAAALWALRET
jgi:hypothetical protein